MSWEDKRDRIYVGDYNYEADVCADETLADYIEVVEITLREETVYDVDLTPQLKARLAKALDDANVPVIQCHAQGTGDVVKASRDLGVKALFESTCRPYHPYGYDDWKQEIRSAFEGGADIIKPSITTPRKWAMGEEGMTPAMIAQRAVDAVKYARDLGSKRVTLGLTDAPRTDINHLIDVINRAYEVGADTVLLNDTVGVAKPALIRNLVRRLKRETKINVRLHCHNDFGLATANTLAAVEAGADGVEVVVNGADAARSGIASLAEVVMALLCLYKKDVGIPPEKLIGISQLFAELTAMPIAEQAPVVAERNWMYKRDHIMRTIVRDESIQFPYSPSLVGEHLHIGLGRGTGQVGVRAKLQEIGVTVNDADVPVIVKRVTEEAIRHRRRLTDDEFRDLVRGVTRINTI